MIEKVITASALLFVATTGLAGSPQLNGFIKRDMTTNALVQIQGAGMQSSFDKINSASEEPVFVYFRRDLGGVQNSTGTDWLKLTEQAATPIKGGRCAAQTVTWGAGCSKAISPLANSVTVNLSAAFTPQFGGYYGSLTITCVGGRIIKTAPVCRYAMALSNPDMNGK